LKSERAFNITQGKHNEITAEFGDMYETG